MKVRFTYFILDAKLRGKVDYCNSLCEKKYQIRNVVYTFSYQSSQIFVTLTPCVLQQEAN